LVRGVVGLGVAKGDRGCSYLILVFSGWPGDRRAGWALVAAPKKLFQGAVLAVSEKDFGGSNLGSASRDGFESSFETVNLRDHVLGI
jgi:hypothetical protein